MAKLQRKGAEEARAQLPALLAAAERGRTTIVTRRGRSIAAVVPVGAVAGRRQVPLTTLAGSGKGLWGSASTLALRRLRDEWSR
jgi:prevent-host-death family protein